MTPRIRGRILACLALTAAVLIAPLLPPPPAYADPCFFSDAEWNQWFNGPRWGTSMTTIEDNIAHCQGTWYEGNPIGAWNGHTMYMRIWAQADGTQVKMEFAKYATVPTYRVHVKAANSGTWVYEY